MTNLLLSAVAFIHQKLYCSGGPCEPSVSGSTPSSVTENRTEIEMLANVHRGAGTDGVEDAQHKKRKFESEMRCVAAVAKYR